MASASTFMDFIRRIQPMTATRPGDSYRAAVAGATDLGPVLGGVEGAHADNPLIRQTELVTGDYEGSETVTYYYGSSFLNPEPASLVMLTLGVTAVAALAWRRRRVGLAA
jgi:hypothetical protein